MDNNAPDKKVELNEEYYLKLFHDLRSYLTVIGGYTSLLLDDEEIGLADEHKDYLVKIRKGYKNMLSLLNDTTDLIIVKILSKSLNKKELDFKNIISKAADAAKAELKEKNITLEQNLPDNPMLFSGEEELMVKTVYHCLAQFILFAPEESVIKSAIFSKEDKCLLSISSSGANIPQEEIPNLFIPFLDVEWLTSYGKKKIGINMAIVKEIMELHNGSVLVESDPKKGMEIILEIPKIPK